MPRFSVREFVFLCVPIAVIGLGFLIPSLLHPPKDPNAKIALTVKRGTVRTAFNPQYPQIGVAWEAEAVGGPQYGYHIGFHEEVVARTKAGTRVIYSDPPTASVSNNVSTSGGSGFTPGVKGNASRELQLSPQDVTPGARLEWHGDFVAVPREAGMMSSAASPAQLAKWAQVKGSARVQKILPIAFDTQSNAVKVSLDAVNAVNASRGSDTCVAIRLSGQRRYECRRLIAFDGKTTRILWKDSDGGLNPYWQGEQSSGMRPTQNDWILFKLRDVPVAWGEISFLFDVVYLNDDSTIEGNYKRTDLATLLKAEKAGGTHLSRRLTVRKTGSSIKGVPLSNAAVMRADKLEIISLSMPNEAGNDVEYRLWMRYIGKNSNPTITVPQFDLWDDKRRLIETNQMQDEAQRKPDGSYSVSHWGKMSALKGIQKVRVSAQVTDGQTRLQKLDAIGLVSSSKK